jgi:hypothetical protein
MVSETFNNFSKCCCFNETTVIKCHLPGMDNVVDNRDQVLAIAHYSRKLRSKEMQKVAQVYLKYQILPPKKFIESVDKLFSILKKFELFV